MSIGLRAKGSSQLLFGYGMLIYMTKKWKWGVGLLVIIIFVSGLLYYLFFVRASLKGIPAAVALQYYELKSQYGSASIGECLRDNENMFYTSGGHNLGCGMTYYYHSNGKLISSVSLCDNLPPIMPPGYISLRGLECRWRVLQNKAVDSEWRIVNY
jgi:hypothetical protein